jgi:hypothetical protein
LTGVALDRLRRGRPNRIFNGITKAILMLGGVVKPVAVMAHLIRVLVVTTCYLVVITTD